MPISPSPPSFATISYGNRFSRSSSSATGLTSPSAKSRTSRRMSCCSSVRSNCMRRGMLVRPRARLAERGPAAEADQEGGHHVLVGIAELPEPGAGSARVRAGQLGRLGWVEDEPSGEAELAPGAAVRVLEAPGGREGPVRERGACHAEAERAAAAGADALP